MAIVPNVTPTPIPAFAPVERLDGLDVVPAWPWAVKLALEASAMDEEWLSRLWELVVKVSEMTIGDLEDCTSFVVIVNVSEMT